MTKIMLVEDDNNLREIYQARLSSEGYDTVTASDGEEALSIVGREKPDLIILDVMMPKISGFDTLDLLKNNPLTRDIKVIMMTALSQAEDRARAQKLGAQNYLVKSQVTLEDIVKAIKDALDGTDVYPGTETTEAPATSAFPETPVASVFNTAAPAEDTNNAPVETPVASSEPIMQPPADLTASPDATTTPVADSSTSMFDTPAPVASSEPIMQPPADLTASMPDATTTPVADSSTSMFGTTSTDNQSTDVTSSDGMFDVSNNDSMTPAPDMTASPVTDQPSTMFSPTTPAPVASSEPIMQPPADLTASPDADATATPTPTPSDESTPTDGSASTNHQF